MSKNNGAEASKFRIVNLDLLRGFFIIMALDQHFTYYLNMWYVEYFRDATALTSTYKIHYALIGKQLPTDHFNQILDFLFTPWVSQIYIALSCFNLSRRTPADFKIELTKKLKMFGLIYLFFVLENFIVAPDMGQAISFYPIMLWMIVMALISVLYSFFGITGIIGLAILSLFRWFLPIDMLSDFFETWMINHVHPSFEYDARIEYFLMSGCLGFAMGYIHYHQEKMKEYKDKIFIALGLSLILCYHFFGDAYIQDAADVFAHEHDLARTFTGTLFILGIQAIIISMFLWLEKRSIKFDLPVVSWVGQNSLLIFAIHRIFFVRILAPISALIGTWYDRPLGASTIEVYTYVIITIFFCYFVKKSRISDFILQRK